MPFLERLLARLPREAVGIRHVWIGPYWTAVETETGGVGLAATQLGPGPTHGEHARWMPGTGRLTSLSARELAENVCAEFPLARSVGLAALNALLPVSAAGATERNAAELALEKAVDKTVGVVGWFPFIPRLQSVASVVHILEKDPLTGFDLTPERRAVLADCGVVLMTASTLVNGSVDGILDALRPGAWRMLVGPGAPLSAETLRLGFDAVCGVRVLEAEPVVRVLQEGGCFQQIRRTQAVQLLALETPISFDEANR